MKENIFKLGRIYARFELVCVAETQNSQFLCAQQFINVEHLTYLLERYPLIVPFCNRTNLSSRKTFIDLIRSIPQHVVNVLENLNNNFSSKGGLLNVWKAYQYELAAEIFWKGRPHSFIDNVYGNNLGPGGALPERSKTWSKGFLCLEDCLSCALGESSIPPLTFHKLGKLEEEKIRRIFSLSDFLNGSDKVLGVRCLLILLNDILNDPRRQADCDRSFISDLKQKSCPTWGNLTGEIGIRTLCERLCVTERYTHPYVFGRAIQLISECGRDPTAILEIGIYELKLNYFPDVRFVDASRNKKISWCSKGVLKVFKKADSNTMENSAKELPDLTRDIIIYMEEQGLVFKSKFASYYKKDPDFAFPWLYDVCAKLGKDYLSRDHYLVLLAYLTCVGLLQNAWYVDFRTFNRFHSDLHSRNPRLLEKLKACEILSVFTLRIGMNVRIHRLHESLPCMLCNEVSHKDQQLEEVQAHNESDELMESETMDTESAIVEYFAVDIPMVHDDGEIVSKGRRMHCPSGLRSKWSPEELDILYGLVDKSFGNMSDAYMSYQKECWSRCIPDRNLESFRRKYRRVTAGAF